jgi:hypothetical protein
MANSAQEKATEKQELQMALEGLKTLFHELHHEADFGNQMLEKMVKTEFAGVVDEAINNPLQASYSALLGIESAVAQLINTAVVEFLKEKKNLIDRVVKPFSTPALFYCIILKKDSPRNRAQILDFLNKYEGSNLQARFRVAFEFIPKDFSKDLKVAEEIAL